MGIDLGEKRVGIAVSDELQLTARGLGVIKRENIFTNLDPLKEMCRQHQVQEIVLGYPLKMNGQVGSAAQEAEHFKEKLQQEIGLPVHLWDERLTTRSAENVLLEADVSRHKRRKVRDKLAAVFILESFLERRKQ